VHFDSQFRIAGGHVDHYLLEKARVTGFARQSDSEDPMPLAITSPSSAAPTLTERNYHVFYQLLEGMRRGVAGLERYRSADVVSVEARDYTYLRSAATVNAPSSQTSARQDADFSALENTLSSFDRLGFQPEHVDRVFDVLLAVLLLGNIQFTVSDGVTSPVAQARSLAAAATASSDGAAEIATIRSHDPVLEHCARLLGVPPSDLQRALCGQTRQFGAGNRQETIYVPNSLAAARSARDALARQLYAQLFDWLLAQVNGALHTQNFVFGSIGVLDIFGFESFAPLEAPTSGARGRPDPSKRSDVSLSTNRLPQLLINYTNEALHAYFNHFVFVMEATEYKREGVPVPPEAFTSFPDNSACIRLIDGAHALPPASDGAAGSSGTPLGGMRAGVVTVLSMLDEELSLPKSSDANYLSRLTTAMAPPAAAGAAAAAKAPTAHFVKSRFGVAEFTVVHYAAPVLYNIAGFVETNRDRLSSDLQLVIQRSDLPFVANLFTAVYQELTFSGKAGAHKAARSATTPTGKGTDIAVSLCGKFRGQLAGLMAALRATQPHFIRCIKPNTALQAELFCAPEVLRQMRYLGLQSVIIARRYFYPVRFTLTEFRRRFWMLCPERSDRVRFASAIQHATAQSHSHSHSHSHTHGKDKATAASAANPALRADCLALVDVLRAAGAISEAKSASSEVAHSVAPLHVGNSKVFLQIPMSQLLEARRSSAREQAVIKVQASLRRLAARRRFAMLRHAVTAIQKVLSEFALARLADRLEKGFATRITASLTHATQCGVPVHVATVVAARACSTQLAQWAAVQTQLSQAARANSDELAVYDTAMNEVR
jgi:myosin heavy subunit